MGLGNKGILRPTPSTTFFPRVAVPRPMRASPWLALLPLLVLLAAPAEAQEGDPLCIIFVEPEEDFEVIRMRADLILDQDERARIAAEVDADGDGTMTAAEVGAYEASQEETLTRVGDMETRILYLDGASPRELIVRVKLTNWTGPVETARNGTVTEHREYRMGTVPYDYEHLISGGLGAHPYRIPKPVVEVVIIRAPEGWLVTGVSQDAAASNATNGTTPVTASPGFPSGNLFNGANKSVTLSGFDLHASYVMTFRDETPTYPTGGLPGFEALAAVAALGVIAVAWRSRRRSP